MRRLLILIALLLWPAWAAAQDLPALFDVTGVAKDDVLNIRAEPKAGAPLLGAFTPDATGIEVVTLSPSGTWGMVRVGEQMGWTSLRYLARQPNQAAIPGALRCGGTEPFWSLLIAGGSAEYTSLAGDADTLTGLHLTRASNTTRVYGGFAEGKGGLASIVVERRLCGDGMSDVTFGFTIALSRNTPGAPQILSGCCSLN
ncbi:MAG: hypothetical protein ACU0DW_02925 [Shimia sp.]